MTGPINARTFQFLINALPHTFNAHYIDVVHPLILACPTCPCTLTICNIRNWIDLKNCIRTTTKNVSISPVSIDREHRRPLMLMLMFATTRRRSTFSSSHWHIPNTGMSNIMAYNIKIVCAGLSATRWRRKCAAASSSSMPCVNISPVPSMCVRGPLTPFSSMANLHFLSLLNTPYIHIRHMASTCHRPKSSFL